MDANASTSFSTPLGPTPLLRSHPRQCQSSMSVGARLSLSLPPSLS